MRPEIVLFLARNYREATFWAQIWGHTPATARCYGFDQCDKVLRGIKNPTVYVCGSEGVPPEVAKQLDRIGATIIDAQDVEFERDPSGSPAFDTLLTSLEPA